MKTFSFREQLGMSFGAGADVVPILLEQIPGALGIRKADTFDDRSGTDYWIDHARGVPVSVDTKVRSKDYGKDDLALETWSVMPCAREPTGKIGWTLDDKKRTDYILWWWKDSRRFAFVPFLQLCAVFKKFRAEWEIRFRLAVQPNKNWKSECLFVPRREVWAAIYKEAAGTRDPLYEYRQAEAQPESPNNTHVAIAPAQSAFAFDNPRPRYRGHE